MIYIFGFCNLAWKSRYRTFGCNHNHSIVEFYLHELLGFTSTRRGKVMAHPLFLNITIENNALLCFPSYC